MKYVWIILVLLLSKDLVTAQVSGFNVYGGGVLTYGKHESLNFIIDRYNETRPFLADDMNSIQFAPGATAGAEVVMNNVIFIMGYYGLKKMTSAQGVDQSNELVKRQLRFKMHSGLLGLGFFFASSASFGMAGKFQFTYGKFTPSTRVGPLDQVGSINYEIIGGQRMAGFMPAIELRFGSVALGWTVAIQPYYFYSFTNLDITSINEAINPVTWIGDPNPIEWRPNHWGCEIRMGYSMVKKR